MGIIESIAAFQTISRNNESASGWVGRSHIRIFEDELGKYVKTVDGKKIRVKGL
jgi:hypothetical protein